jgi:23S rRNA (adenine2503-C2)-methyltransferase
LEDNDKTVKFVLKLSDGNFIESVLIPTGNRLALCISTQVGCPFDCIFCLTAKVGFKRNLDASEIIGQYLVARRILRSEKIVIRGSEITHIVFMGMGEPLLNFRNVVRAIRILKDDFGANFSSRKITISTGGITPKIVELGRTERVSLNVSLNAPSEEKRRMLMPDISRKYPLGELLEVLRNYPSPARHIITFEYVLIKGVNDSERDASELARVLKSAMRNGNRFKVNVIPYNSFEGSPFRRPSEGDVERFCLHLTSLGVTATVRKSRGGGIMAACGQLGSTVMCS